MQRQSEQALQHMEIAADVESSVETHGPSVGQTLNVMHAHRFENREDGLTAPDFVSVIVSFGEQLGDSRRHVADADHEHVERLRQIIDLRQERDDSISKLYQHFSIARRTIDQFFGSGKAFVIGGLEGPTAQKPTKLLRQAELAIARLEQPDLQLPAIEVEGFDIDPAAVAAGLRAKVERLRQVLADLRVLRREAQASRKVKNRALAAHQPTYLSIARALESFYRLAGEDELADRIRSSSRTGRRATEAAGEGTDPGTPTPDAPQDTTPDGASADGEAPAAPAVAPADSPAAS